MLQMMMPLITVSTVVVVVVVERQRKKERDREKETNNHYKLWVRLTFGIGLGTERTEGGRLTIEHQYNTNTTQHNTTQHK